MSNTDFCAARRLIEEIAGPPRGWDDKIKRMIGVVADATGLAPRTVRGAWNGEQTSLRTIERLRHIAENKARLAEAFESGNAVDRARADVLRRQARGFYSAAERG